MLITVIVPVYNVAKYLSRCLDSLLNQTYSDFELILVDDGSKDSSLDICNDYALRDCRIKVMHKRNGGVSTARNVGINVAQGKWICFVDSDDYVTPNYLKLMIENAQGWKNDKVYMVLTGMQSKIWHKKLPTSLISSHDVPEFIASNIPLGPYCKLFLTTILNEHGIRFKKEISNGEDFIFVCEYLKYTDGISCFDSAEYIYEIHPQSVSKKHLSFEENLKNYLSMRKAWLDLVELSQTNLNKNYLLWHSGVQIRFSYLLTGLFYKSITIKEQKVKLLSIRSDIKDFSENSEAKGIRCRFARFLLKHELFLLYILFNRFLIVIGKDPVA